jgi:SAM-dependent methyltransferase
MSGFSPEWLALREGVDHRSRDPVLADRLARHFAGQGNVRIVDLGCGTGSNIRATSVLLGPLQSWTLVDYDARLLAAARAALTGWADGSRQDGDALVLEKGGRTLHVRFREADLNRALDAALGDAPDLVTASALFDLCSPAFLDELAKAVAKRRAGFYTVLTYNGVQTWTPEHPADQAMAAAFHAHQKTDKGFGVSSGPDAPAVLAAAFERVGYTVEEGDSPWVLGPPDQHLIHELASGFASAVAETGALAGSALDDWRAVRRTGAVVGHTDTLALPR